MRSVQPFPACAGSRDQCIATHQSEVVPPHSMDEDEYTIVSHEPEPPRPPRRPRYAGRHPRHFDQKYKEHQPDKYADDVAKVIASGKTPAGSHRAIMMSEVLNALRPQPGEVVIDCTLGYGGHALELLQAIQPGGRLIGLDADPIELPKTQDRIRLRGFNEESFVAVRTNFAGLMRSINEHAPGGVDMLLADLGLSSMQIDDPARGFTFKESGPLDMRMNPQRGQSAADWLKSVDLETLTATLIDNADEPNAATISRYLVHTMATSPLQTTHQLSEAIRRAIGRVDNEVAAASVQRVFQAIRIAVNDEFAVLDRLLKQIPNSVKPGGRIAILSFHSGEDRRVKLAFRRGLEAGTYIDVAPDVIRASYDEQRSNPRSSPAKLRWAVRSSLQ